MLVRVGEQSTALDLVAQDESARRHYSKWVAVGKEGGANCRALFLVRTSSGIQWCTGSVAAFPRQCARRILPSDLVHLRVADF